MAKKYYTIHWCEIKEANVTIGYPTYEAMMVGAAKIRSRFNRTASTWYGTKKTKIRV